MVAVAGMQVAVVAEMRVVEKRGVAAANSRTGVAECSRVVAILLVEAGLDTFVPPN